MTLGMRYELTNQRLRIFEGVFNRSLNEIDLVHVREAKFTQHPGERMANIGTSSCSPADSPRPTWPNKNEEALRFARKRKAQSGGRR